MDNWRKVFRDGLAPLLSVRALEALQQALASDDVHLIQGETTIPGGTVCKVHWPVDGACLLAYPGWQTEGMETVAEVETFFASLCASVDDRMGEQASCRHLIEWFDDTDRDEMRKELLAEVELALAERVTM